MQKETYSARIATQQDSKMFNQGVIEVS